MGQLPPRFFTPELLSTAEPGCCIELDATASHHVARVLRLREGTEVELFDGKGGRARATIVSTNRRAAAVRVEGAQEVPPEWPVRIVMAVAAAKAKALDTVARKLSELNVAELVPVLTARCQGRRGAEREMSRRRRIAVEAAKQSRRNYLLKIHPTVPLADFVANRPEEELRLIASTTAGPEPICRVTDRAGRRDGVVCLIGPEGGWGDAEQDLATAAGFTPVSLGTTILRVETAATAAAAILMNSLRPDSPANGHGESRGQ